MPAFGQYPDKGILFFVVIPENWQTARDLFNKRIGVDLQVLTMQQSIAKNIAVVCNPLAGAGRAVVFADKICRELTTKNKTYSLFTESWPDHFDGFTDIFIVGGDGTLNYFINKYPGIKLPLAVFNAGTGNDFHWMLYGSKTFDEQMQIVLGTLPKPVDIGRCNENYFINGVGIGFEGEVARALTGRKKRPGKTSFLFCILQKIFTYRSKNYSINSAESIIAGKKLLVDIANGRRAGGGFHIAPESEANDGFFDVVVADALNSLERLRYLPVIEKGKHMGLAFIHHYRSKKIVIESDAVLQYHLDGEYGEAKKMEIEMLPAQLLFRY